MVSWANALLGQADPPSILGVGGAICLVLAMLLAAQISMFRKYSRSLAFMSLCLAFGSMSLLSRALMFGATGFAATLLHLLPASLAFCFAMLSICELYGRGFGMSTTITALLVTIVVTLVWPAGPAAFAVSMLAQVVFPAWTGIRVWHARDLQTPLLRTLLLVVGSAYSVCALAALFFVAAQWREDLNPLLEMDRGMLLSLLLVWSLVPSIVYALTSLAVNARVAATLHDQATTDALTGLRTRREFFRAARASLSMASGEQGSFAVLMIDIDHFKKINDELGHAVGDRVIRVVAERIRGALRSDSIVGRLGGEEFGAVVPIESVAQAEAIGERLRARIAATLFGVEGCHVGVTVSVGVALGGEGAMIEDLLAIADQSLYEAKRSGRNRVVTNSRPVSGATAATGRLQPTA